MFKVRAMLGPIYFKEDNMKKILKTSIMLIILIISCGEKKENALTKLIQKNQVNFTNLTIRAPKLENAPKSNDLVFEKVSYLDIKLVSTKKDCETIEKKRLEAKAEIDLQIKNDCAYKMDIKAYGVVKQKNINLDEIKDIQTDYENDIKPILERKCISCHNKNGAMPAYDLTTIEKNILYIEETISRIEIGNMPPPNLNDPLSFYEVSLFKKWKENGFRENSGAYQLICESSINLKYLSKSFISPKYEWVSSID